MAERRRALVVQRTGWGKSAVYFVATALLRARGAGPDGDRLAAARADAQPDRGGGAGRASTRARSTRRTSRSGSRSTRRSRAGAGRRAAGQPGAAEQPRLPRPGAAGARRRPRACSWSTRRTASPTGATTSGPTTGGSARCSPSLPAGRPGAGHHRDRERPGDRRRRRAARRQRRRRTTALVLRGPLDRESLHLAVVRLPDRADRLAWLAEHLATALPGSGIIYTLTVAAADETAAFLREQGIAVAAYTGKNDQAERLAAEDDLLGQPGQGARRDLRARHGVRQAGPRVRRAPRRAAVADRLLPADRPRRARRRARRGAAAARPRGPGHLGLLRLARLPAGAPGPRDAARRSPRRAARCPPPRSRRASTCRAAGWRRCSRCSTSTARCAAPPAAGRPPASRGATTASATSGWPRSGARAAGDARLPGATGCRMEFLRRELDDPEAAACGRCDNCTGRPLDRRGGAVRRGGRGRPARPARRVGRAAARCGRPGMKELGIDGASGKIAASADRRAGPRARAADRRGLGQHAAPPARRRRAGRAGHQAAHRRGGARSSPPGTGLRARLRW